MDAPGFSGLARQYGTLSGGEPEDEGWAGRGFTEVPAAATLEPVVDVAA